MHHEIELALKNSKKKLETTNDLIRLYLIDYMENSGKEFNYIDNIKTLISNAIKEVISDKKFIRLLSDKYNSEEFIDSYKDIK